LLLGKAVSDQAIATVRRLSAGIVRSMKDDRKIIFYPKIDNEAIR
jgi:hypothetical protein